MKRYKKLQFYKATQSPTVALLKGDEGFRFA